jgi:Asp-tRNA(Asn)/Glu-tRNA(Gln) amidotransferase A subunit family amidase
MGRPDGDMRLLGIADAFEAITEWHRHAPPA